MEQRDVIDLTGGDAYETKEMPPVNCAAEKLRSKRQRTSGNEGASSVPESKGSGASAQPQSEAVLGERGFYGMSVKALAEGIASGIYRFEGLTLSEEDRASFAAKLMEGLDAGVYKDEEATNAMWAEHNGIKVYLATKNKDTLVHPRSQEQVEAYIAKLHVNTEDDGIVGDKYHTPNQITSLAGRPLKRDIATTPDEKGWAMFPGKESLVSYTPGHIDRGTVFSVTMIELPYTFKVWAWFKSWKAMQNAEKRMGKVAAEFGKRAIMEWAHNKECTLLVQGPGDLVFVSSGFPHAVLTLHAEDSCLENPQSRTGRVAFCGGNICVPLHEWKTMYESCRDHAWQGTLANTDAQFEHLYDCFKDVPAATHAFKHTFNVLLSTKQKVAVMHAHYRKIVPAGSSQSRKSS